MKQEMSILKWASLMLEEEVKTLSAIQDVRFIKHLLWKIDPAYFCDWQSGRGTESFAQVVSAIGKYFKQQIGTDIKQFIQTLNVFKNPMDLWELLLGIAIKGSNRGNNINLILDMDHTVQAELVGIVSSIIDKFGQGAASHKDGLPDEKEEEQPVNQQQLMVDLMQQHEQLTNRIIQLQAELYKEQQQNKNVVGQKKELEQQIFMYKLEKASFLQTLANGNRSDSRIFDDGEETVLQTGNLTELANDIIVFVRGLRRRVNEEMEKNSLLEEELRQTKYQAVRAAQENESYLLQLGNLNVYQNQIDMLRQQINQVFNENAMLIDKINQLEEDKSKLILSLRKKRKESQELQQEVEQNQVKIQEIVQKRKKVQFQSQQQENGSNHGSEYHKEPEDINKSEGGKSEGDKNTARDELREPKLRTKLQRQIQFLKVSNETLKRQNSSLKLANENLQQSARQFLISNQTIVRSWQQDFKVLMYQINQMGQEAQIEEQYELQEQEEQPPQNAGVEVEVQHEEVMVEKQNDEVWEQKQSEYQKSIEQAERQREAEIEKARQLQNKLQSITLEMNRQRRIKNQHQNEVQLWREIAGKLKGLVARFRQNEINYQNTIYSLKLENAQLAKSLEQSLLPPPPPSKISKENVKISIQQRQRDQFDSEIKRNDQFQLKINQISQELQGQILPKQGQFLSYISIKEGEELDEDTINKRNSQRSHFYQAESKIVKEIKENPIVSQSQLQEKYITLNRRLFSESKASLFNLKTEFTGNEVAKTAQLQARFQNEIKKMEEQYAWLNGSYQELFRKLNIYTDQLRVKQYAKMEGMKLLQEIENEEWQTIENKQSEIIKLSELNKHLRAALLEQTNKKQQLLQIIRDIQSFGHEFFKNKQNSYELNIKKMMVSLEEIKHSFSQSLKEPMQFLDLRLEGESSGKVEQFYNLYSKQRQKNKQLTVQLELLTSTLLEYRNILQF